MFEFTIANRLVGVGHAVFIVAELSCNHRQDFAIALKSIEAIKECGADAVKLSTDKPDGITLNCDNEYFQIKQGTLWDGTILYKLYQETHTPWEWQPELKRYAESLGLICFSTPTCFEGVDFLQGLSMPCFKVASFEITDIPLIEKIAKLGKPMLISTGIATLQDIELAVATCRKAGNEQIALLKCTSAYPTPLDEMHLRTIPNMRETFQVQVGLSDHSVEMYAPIVATSLGATIIEKHFILDRNLGGPDAAFSLNKDEFQQMVQAVRASEKVLGRVEYNLSEKTKRSREFSKSLFVAADIQKGQAFDETNLRPVRPGFGLHPIYYKEVLGKVALEDLKMGTPLQFQHVQWR